MSGTDNALTHTHEHTHRRRHPDAIGRSTLVFHSHEHSHTSYSEWFRTEAQPIHRKHFHTPRQERDATT